MDLDFKKHLPPDFSGDSRVWIYQSSRLFLISEALELEDILQQFVQQWKSHGVPVKGYANLFFGRFIIFMADESATAVGGCSTDSSVQVIKEIGKKYNVEMFNRQLLAFVVRDKIEVFPLAQFKHAIDNSFINENTLYFDNTVLTKEQLEDRWITPLKESWLRKQLQPSNI